ncbi:MAG: geranylgeranylglyceryl/heptaprenylglyceryl phosphate synthase [Ignavibacteriales bacterium]|nr:geranylgeranylglyceryl/heptaprenylglyceryl phosphate synthase [Ignavibacteriales bacterium]MCB9258068.1 geranylgeranylglyceryl/heptaprenylglyceryl phosphate synthase [Ignavibacteriales bacterium]
MKILKNIEKTISDKGAAYFILIDPDKLPLERTKTFIEYCENAGVDGFLIGGSLMIHGNLDESIIEVKKYTNLPVIIFPGSINQVSKNADAILFISLISGRNAEHLIGKHVQAAPLMKKYGLESIPTGYMLIESGQTTTAEYISESKPIPRNKPEIAAATALAGEYLGMKLIYLEGGSGAQKSVPTEMIKLVTSQLSIPVIVGGGIKTPMEAREKVDAGAEIIVTGNFFEYEKNWSLIKDFADSIHKNQPQKV